MKKFEGKVALVTGAAHGIGKQIATQFAQEGANTVIVDYNPETGTKTAEEITKEYQKSLFVQADVSDPDAMMNVREKVFEEFGKIDILVLNAGVAFRNKMVDISFEEWNKTLGINLTGLFNTVKAFYNDFLTNNGSIVYISSGSALSGTGGGVSYPASKAGGEGLIRGLAKELGPHGVNVNAIAPGYMATELYTALINDPNRNKDILARIPAHRWGTADDLKGLTIFLASDASDYMAGACIPCDGGYLGK